MQKRYRIFRDRQPALRREVDGLLLLTLVSFGLSVSLVRLFLYLTGYPQLGGGELHIAHVLWGGLFLFMACLVVLIFTNRGALIWCAVLGGVGMGFFIDEVGKFITASNDYFFPSAAPIIYVVFLLTVMVFLRLRRVRRDDSRTLLFSVLTDLEEILDRDLSEPERQDLLARLENVGAQADCAPDSKKLAEALTAFLKSPDLQIVHHRQSLEEKLEARLERWEDRWLTRKMMRWILAGLLLVWTGWAFLEPVKFLIHLLSPNQLQNLAAELSSHNLINNPIGLTWFEVRIMLEGLTGLLSLAAAVLLVLKKDRAAVRVAIVVMVVLLALINLLLFYFEQFSTIFQAIYQLLLLLLLNRYRLRFLEKDKRATSG